MSDHICLTVDVHCNRPTWVFHSAFRNDRDTNYRLYINTDLITERSWIWESNHYISETIYITRPESGSLRIILEPVLKQPQSAFFSLKNIKIDGQEYAHNALSDTEVTLLI